MKVYLEGNERYPDYSLSRDTDGIAIEISNETFERWVRVCKEYNQVQNEMSTALNHVRRIESEATL